MHCKILGDLKLKCITEVQSIVTIRSPLQLWFSLFKLVLWYVQLDSS